jgi:O-antigen ligase
MTLISIAAAEILLAAAVAGHLWILKRHKGPIPPGMKIFLPLLVYMIWAIIAALVSSNPALGLTIAKKYYLFLLVAVVPLTVRGEGRLTWIYRAVFVTAVVASLYGLIQFAANPNRDLLHRISGFMSHWMTYSGLLMLVLVLLVAYVSSYGLRGHLWVLLTAAYIILALVFAQTRGTWLGALAGIAVVILMRRLQAIAGLIAVILVFYFLSPSGIQQRFKSGLDPTDPNTRNRIELFQTSARLIRDNPWFGVGPKNVKFEALKYRGKKNGEFPDWMYQHMHNNILQVASETGIPGLVIWLWFMVRLAWDACRAYRRVRQSSFPAEEEIRKEGLMVSSAALGAWAALMVAGMLEYNFGDSEVLMLFLFIMSAPYAFLPLHSCENGPPEPSGRFTRLEQHPTGLETRPHM